MTITGQVFTGYAEAVIERHGYGSNKMVNQWDNRRRERIVMRGQRLVDRCTWAKESISMDADKFDAAIAGGDEGKRLWDEVAAADKYLLENGYIREYSFSTHQTVAGTGVLCNFRHYTKYGLTAKGWAVARKYLDATK